MANRNKKTVSLVLPSELKENDSICNVELTAASLSAPPKINSGPVERLSRKREAIVLSDRSEGFVRDSLSAIVPKVKTRRQSRSQDKRQDSLAKKNSILEKKSDENVLPSAMNVDEHQAEVSLNFAGFSDLVSVENAHTDNIELPGAEVVPSTGSGDVYDFNEEEMGASSSHESMVKPLPQNWSMKVKRTARSPSKTAIAVCAEVHRNREGQPLHNKNKRKRLQEQRKEMHADGRKPLDETTLSESSSAVNTFGKSLNPKPCSVRRHRLPEKNSGHQSPCVQKPLPTDSVTSETKTVRKLRCKRGKKKCPSCGKMLAANYMNYHLNLHRADGFTKPFPCEFCDAKFSCPSNLKVHMYIHTEHKPFLCMVCKKRFADASTRRKHRLAKH